MSDTLPDMEPTHIWRATTPSGLDVDVVLERSGIGLSGSGDDIWALALAIGAQLVGKMRGQGKWHVRIIWLDGGRLRKRIHTFPTEEEGRRSAEATVESIRTGTWSP